MKILQLITRHNYRFFFLSLASIATGALGFGFFVEYVIGFEPCVLCLYQRIPYLLFILLSLTGVVFINKSYHIMLGISFVILSAIFLAGYHTGIERNIWNPTDTCNMGVKIPLDMPIEEVMEMLYNAPIATCTVAAYRIFRISMTEWNLIVNIILLGIVILAIREKHRHPREGA